jgi:hypothetical protein
MKPDAPYTLRWMISNKWGDMSQRDKAYDLITDIIGDGRPVATTPTVETAPVATVPPVDTMRIALVVGHNKSAPGAWVTTTGFSESEFIFNNKVADHIIADGIEGITFEKFNRVPNRNGYSREIAEVYGRVNAFEPSMVVEMHFNGGGGDYCTMLAADTSPVSQKLARAMAAVFAKDLGIPDRGTMQRSRSDRGGLSLFSSEAPAVLTEPFFGDHPRHAATVAQMGHRNIATIYRKAIVEAARLI